MRDFLPSTEKPLNKISSCFGAVNQLTLDVG